MSMLHATAAFLVIRMCWRPSVEVSILVCCPKEGPAAEYVGALVCCSVDFVLFIIVDHPDVMIEWV